MKKPRITVEHPPKDPGQLLSPDEDAFNQWLEQHDPESSSDDSSDDGPDDPKAAQPAPTPRPSPPRR